MLTRGTLSCLLAVAAYLDHAEAFWRMGCSKIQTGRVDPVVSPGRISAHTHTIVGGSNVGINSTFNSLLQSECTSCEIEDDKSAYWTPQLYYQMGNGSFLEVPHDGSVVYYLGRGVNKANIQPFPEGFQMLSGDSAARSYDKTKMTYGTTQYPARPLADRVSFNCLDVSPIPEQPYMFRTDCKNGLRAQIHFQSCWDGVNLYKTDNSHVAYMSGIDNGICPPTHPVQLVHLFLETVYNVNKVNQTDGGRFVFAQGDATGYGFHGDFQNGWVSEVQKQALKDCAVPDLNGLIANCPVLARSQTDAYRTNCPERPPQIQEQVKGLLAQLPGCNRVTTGPDRASSADMVCPAGVVQPAIATTVDSTPIATLFPTPSASFGAPGWTYVSCTTDSAQNRTLIGQNVGTYYQSANNMTVESCQNYCGARNYRYAGVEFGTECYCGNVIGPAATFDADRCYYRCSGRVDEVCGGPSRLSLFVNSAINPPSATTSAPVIATLKPLPSNFVGCATDSATARSLNGSVSFPQIAAYTLPNMTVDLCAAYCGSKNNAFYGIEYGSECWCGDSLVNGGALMPNTSACNMRCAGDQGQICGGSKALSLYANPTYQRPKVVQTVSKYVTKGCLAEPAGARALTGAMMSSDSMTVETCIKFCVGKAMSYAGLEFGKECYCGTKLMNSPKTVASSQCNMLCKGNLGQYCGGSQLLNLYYSSSR